MSHPFPDDKFFQDRQDLARAIQQAYGLPEAECQLLSASMRDVYLIASREERYAFFLYRHNQRTPQQITAEWNFIDNLKAAGVPVAPAVRQRNRELLLTIPRPEGVRYGVLSTFVEGNHLRNRYSIEAVRDYGRAIARIHVAADALPEITDRPSNDFNFIVQQYIQAIEEVVYLKPEDRTALHEAAGTLREKLDVLPRQKPEYGMIHGDVIRANAQVSEDGKVTVLDFDLCGPGWRAYDIAGYFVVAEHTEAKQAFLDAYQEIRPLGETEIGWLPLFEAARNIFSLGIPAMNAIRWGQAPLSDRGVEIYLEGVRRNLKIFAEGPAISTRGGVSVPEIVVSQSELDRQKVERIIRHGFADVPYPGDEKLARSNVIYFDDDNDIYEFTGKRWNELSADFIERHRYTTALMTLDALIYYLPAYLLACLDPELFENEGLYLLSILSPPTWGGTVDQQRFDEFLSKLSPAMFGAIIAFMKHMAATVPDSSNQLLGEQMADYLAEYYSEHCREQEGLISE